MARNTVIGSIIGFVVGLVQMLVSMSEPSTTGPAMAVAILMPLYAFAFCGLICYPMESSLRKWQKETAERPSASAVLTGFVVILAVVVAFSVLLNSFAIGGA